MSTYRVETFSRWKLFCGHFGEKKLIAKILWRRERACGRVFEILMSVVALLLSLSFLSIIIFYDVHDDVHDDDDARTFTLSFPLGITEQSVPFF